MTDPNHLFTLRVPPMRQGEPAIMVRAYDAPRPSETGHNYIDLEVRHGREVIFPRGQLFCGVNQWTSIDGTEARELALSAVAMKPGDTDRDYFAGYTPAQLAWAEEHGEHVSAYREHRFCDPETGAVRKGAR